MVQGKSKHLDPDKVKAVVEKLKQSEGVAAIRIAAERFGVDHRTIRTILEKAK